MALSPDKLQQLKEKVIADNLFVFFPGEEVNHFFTTAIDWIIITNRRLIFIDNNFTSKKRSITSIKYSSITSISITRPGGMLAIGQEVEITVSGRAIEIKFIDSENAKEFYRAMSLILYS